MARLSVVVITKDEETNMSDFLANHSFADEIIVVDATSKDHTIEICRAAGARVIENEWPGFPIQWNIGIDAATGDWILLQDADQRVTPELESSLKELLHREVVDYDAFYIPRRNIAFGRWIRHCGWYPDMPYPRLFRKDSARFDENKTVHEKLLFSGRTTRLDADIVHYTYSSMEEYVDKLNKYTSLEAHDRLAMYVKGKSIRSILIDGKIPWRSKTSYLKPRLPLKPLLRFIWMYGFKLGFLDGKHGFWICTLSSFYEAVADAKVWLNAQYGRRGTS